MTNKLFIYTTIFALAFMWWALGGKNTKTIETDDYSVAENTQVLLAFDYAAEYTASQLKSPGTASFIAWYSQPNEVTSIVPGTYVVQSWVDSQNGLGATIRSNFYCVVTFEENDKVVISDFLIY